MVLSEIPTKTRYEAKTDIINSIALIIVNLNSYNTTICRNTIATC